MELKFRNLRAEEIEVRAQVNQDGVVLLLYKDARCDQNILDEKVGPTGWQRHHLRNNANCVVAIYDRELKQWIEKEDTGTRSSTEGEKGLASDSFKRACVNWGIGRELYTAPYMFIPKNELRGYVSDEKNPRCNDMFKVAEINYNENVIESVIIDVYALNTLYQRKKFSKNNTGENIPSSIGNAVAVSVSNTADTTVKNPSQINSKSLISDDEVILIGNCRGHKYGDVKDKKVFQSFLNWVKTANTSYKDALQQEQFTRLKKLATTAV